VIQVPVEGDFLDRWIKSTGIFINAGWRKVPDKPSKARYNDAVVSE
jgi:hypothetical protein